MINYEFGQFNEIYELMEYIRLNNINVPKYVVDVGCGDGIYLSNSRHLIIRAGWKGLLIDGNKEQIANCKSYYSSVDGVFVHQAIVTDIPQHGYLSNIPDWSISSFISSSNDNDERTYTLSSIINHFVNEPIGLLSIDIEGYDTVVIKEFLSNTNIYPMFIIIEHNTSEHEIEQSKIISSYGYKDIFHNKINTIWSRI